MGCLNIRRKCCSGSVPCCRKTALYIHIQMHGFDWKFGGRKLVWGFQTKIRDSDGGKGGFAKPGNAMWMSRQVVF